MLSVSVQHVALARHHDTHDVLASRNFHGRVIRDCEKWKWQCEEDENTQRVVSAPGSSTPISLLSIATLFLANYPPSSNSPWPHRRICSPLPEKPQIGLRYIALEIMTSPPNSPMSMVNLPEAADGPTSPLPQLPTSSKRVKKLARPEKLQISPSALAQVKSRTPGTPSPLNSNRPVFKQNALEGAQSIISPTARLAKDYDPETPKHFAVVQFSEEEDRKSDVEEDAPIRGFSLQEFLQEDKQKENDELIDTILEKVSSPSIHSPASPSSAQNNSSIKSKRARGKKIGRRLISFGLSKDEEPGPKRKFDPKATSRTAPTNEPSPFTRVTSDSRFPVTGVFENKQAQTVGTLNHTRERGLSVFDFLGLGSGPRPDSPTLGHATVKGSQGDRGEHGQQEEDDVFKIRDTGFSNQRAQKGGPLAYKSPAPLRLPQKHSPNASPSIPTQLLVRDDRDDFLVSTVAALHSVSTTSPTPSNATLSESKTPRRCATTPLSLQRAKSTTSRSTTRFSDTSSTLLPLDRSNRNSIASTAETKRRSFNSIIESRRNSLASIIELKRHSESSNVGKRLSNPRVEELKHDSAETTDEALPDILIPRIVEKRLSGVSAEIAASNIANLGRHFTVKKIRNWTPFPSSLSPHSPLTPGNSGAVLPRSRVVTPKSPLALVRLDGCSQETHEAHKQSVAERVPIATPKILQSKFDNLGFDEDVVQIVEMEAPSLTEEEKQREQKGTFAALLGWNGPMEWGETDKEKKVKCEQIRNALEPQMKIEPKNPSPPPLALEFRTFMEFMSSTTREQNATDTPRTSITETEMSSFDFSRRTSKATSRSETPTYPSFSSISRSTTAQTSWSEATMSPPFGMSRSTSSSEFPLLSPVPSFHKPNSVGYSFSSHLTSRRPSDAAATVSNPFGSLVHWDRPIETAGEKKRRKLLDLKQRLRNEMLEKQGALLGPEMLQLNGRFKGMERYIAHNLVQRDLRKAYDECDKALVSAASVAREYLDLWQPECSSELAFDAPPVVQPAPSSELRLDCGESISMVDECARKCADLTLIGEEGILNFRLVWTQQFLDRCERNGW
ncbi:hypothetical protein EG328_001543 [Venturia inaequalis]|uniref:Uncharacterized protein n=1 Tax=Venturia inaequalis TaxID=5025 RepID=A0A8H3YYA7_VENIN|nr:hypothetical protein EG328_001543 [Venturia inaequalis]